MLYIKTLGGMGSSGELLATSSVCLYRKGVSFKSKFQEKLWCCVGEGGGGGVGGEGYPAII